MPVSWAQPFNLSKKLRGCAAAPVAGIARTTNPLSMPFAKIPKSESLKTSVTSEITNGLRRSGLSFPYLSIDSAYGMRGNSP